MTEVEAVGHNLPELASTVVEANKKLSAADRARAVMRWHSQVEIDMIGKIVAAPKMHRAEKNKKRI